MPQNYRLMNLLVNLPVECQGEPICREMTTEQAEDINAKVKLSHPAWFYVLDPDRFTISFEVVNGYGELISRHSVRNGSEENNVMLVIRRGCPGAVQSKRQVNNSGTPSSIV